MPEDQTDDTSTDDTSTDTSTDTGDDTSTGTDTGTDDAASGDDTDGEAKWKAMARKHEKEAKAARAEADKLRKASLSDQEKAIEEARESGRVEANAAATLKVVAAELKAAGVAADDVADLDLSKFLTEDGEVDADKVAAKGARAKKAATASVGSADGGPQGDRPDLSKATTLEGAVAKALSGGK